MLTFKYFGKGQKYPSAAEALLLLAEQAGHEAHAEEEEAKALSQQAASLNARAGELARSAQRHYALSAEYRAAAQKTE